MTEVLVFAGPCLHGVDVADFSAEMELRPPARRGDVLAALAENPGTLVILDGYFFDELSVTHKELLYAIECGVRVIGAASMGALRAVEMAPFGMIGVGTIFRWYADEVLDGDDEVAVVHAPPELGYRGLSVALVELRHALRGVVDAAPLIRDVKHLAFWERTPERVNELAQERLGAERARQLGAALASFSLKASDAREALELALAPRVREENHDPPARDRPMFLNYWCEDHVRAPVTTSLPTGTTLMRAWNMVQLFHDDAPKLVAQLRTRFLAASAGKRVGLEAAPEDQRRVTGALSSHMEAAYGGCVLPADEVEREARLQVLSDGACEAFGGPEAACNWLATEYGLSAREGHAALMRLLATQYDLKPSWYLVRAFVFCTALRSALRLAEEADEVYRRFRAWSRGARIAREDLVAVAAGIWGCPAPEVLEEAGRRGLQEAGGFSKGVYEVVQRAAPAERLPRPINDYAEKKAVLRSAALEYALPLFPPIDPGRVPSIRPKSQRPVFRVVTARK